MAWARWAIHFAGSDNGAGAAVDVAAAHLYRRTTQEKRQKDFGGTHEHSIGRTGTDTQAYIQLLTADPSAKKEQIVRDTRELNDQQAAVFWPIYHDYQAEQNKLITDKLAAIADYSQNFSSLTDEKADQLAQRVMQLDE